jgi:hypothetical protein
MSSQYEFDVLIGADGKRNTLAGIYFIFFYKQFFWLGHFGLANNEFTRNLVLSEH